MNRFQSISFSGIKDFLAYPPKDQLKIVEALRALICQCIPEVKEKLSYPFYYRYCFYLGWGCILGKGID